MQEVQQSLLAQRTPLTSARQCDMPHAGNHGHFNFICYTDTVSYYHNYQCGTWLL